MASDKKGVPVWVWIVVLAPVVVFVLGVLSALAIFGVRKYIANARQAEAERAAASSAPVPERLPPGVVQLPPLPPMGPLAPLQGEPVDLSSVMGRARKLANQWQSDAALLGIEATLLVDGKIQTADGGRAKLSFGPSSFNVSQPRTGLFVVIYDKTGINGTAVKGVATPELPEPMCAPEFIYRRVAGEGHTATVTLRYALDASHRPVWLALLAADPKAKPLPFDPQTCQSAVVLNRR